MNDFQGLIARAEALLERLEQMLPPVPQSPEWTAATAWRWRHRGSSGWLQPVTHPHAIRLSDLRDIEDQKRRVVENTRQFVAGHPANNVLLTGARGTGKSSLIKALLAEFAAQGLRLVEMDKDHLVDLPELVDLISARAERFIIFCDDLSFEAGDSHYKALKSVLDGSIAATSPNVLVYATSNRRHLMPEYFSENRETRHVEDEIHPGETVEEKISLSDRFGLWVSFYPFDQDAYLHIAAHWVDALGGKVGDAETFRREALQWALMRGTRSGRSAWHFARDWVGRGG
jgi:predicted AAA+ superfamily ATPase